MKKEFRLEDLLKENVKRHLVRKLMKINVWHMKNAHSIKELNEIYAVSIPYLKFTYKLNRLRIKVEMILNMIIKEKR